MAREENTKRISERPRVLEIGFVSSGGMVNKNRR